MAYLLDTNICIYLIKKRPMEVLERFREHPVHEVAISVITRFELQYGVEKSQSPQRTQKALDKFLRPMSVLNLDCHAAAHAAAIRAQLEQKGTPIGPYDLLIAGQALSLGRILVTNNIREFERIPNLRVANWIA
jgi:tRNA(fMet)-specific endonuclease VapC